MSGPRLEHTIDGVREEVALARSAGRTVALVPTMGALHAGHLSLVERASGLADLVVVSIFVNPLQFGEGEDFDRYPRTLEADVAALARHPVSVVFAPDAAEMYPGGASQTRIAAGPVAALFEGAVRPGHFDGMLTVVAKLLNIVQPDVAVFGQKDAQQLFLVRQMVAELNLPVRIDAAPIVREADGLALSSRNRYLSGDEARAALVLSRALAAAAGAGARGADAARAAAHEVIAREPGAELDYAELVDPATFLPVDGGFAGGALAVIAARVGATRLIDNRAVSLH